MAACRRVFSVALLLAAASGEAADARCESNDACASSDAGEDTASVLQVKVSKVMQRAKQFEGREDVKYLPRSGVPVVNYHLAYPSGPEPSMAERGGNRSWIVMFTASTSDEGINNFCDIAERSGSTCAYKGHPTEQGLAFTSLNATEAQVDEMAESFGDVSFLEPDVIYSLPDETPGSENEETPGSEGALLQRSERTLPWGLDRVDTDGSYLDMDGQYTPPTGNGGQGVNVYVGDTGIRQSHQDFGGRAFAFGDFAGSNPLCEAPASPCAWDNHGHGTHCAGTVGGTTFGVAKHAKVHAVKLLSDGGWGYNSWILDGYDAVASRGVRPAVFSGSFGGSGNSPATEAAVSSLVASGVTVVVAAGNSNADACDYSPAFVPAAITVGSSWSGDQMSYFSNYGTCVDIFAPGSSVLSCGVSSDTAQATMSGTSMACPHVSGAAALVLAAHPLYTPANVTTKLQTDALVGKLGPSPPIMTSPNWLLFVGDIPTPLPTPTPTPTTPRPPCL